jgi:hypothetical protein
MYHQSLHQRKTLPVFNKLRPSPKLHPGFIRAPLRLVAKFRMMPANKGGCMKTMHLIFVTFIGCMVLVVGLSAGASASCGDTLAAMATGAAHLQSPSLLTSDQSQAEDVQNSPIVGLWHTQFIVGTQTIQEAFQLWNVGGTEIHNPNVDPRTGNVCLGVWKDVGHGNYKLVHRVWDYDANGNFGGTIHLTETIRMGNHGTTHSGSFALDFFDATGNFQFEVAGKVVADRISVD